MKMPYQISAYYSVDSEGIFFRGEETRMWNR